MSSKKKISNAAAELGRRGGKAVVKKHGKDYMSKIAKKGLEKRWEANRKKNDDTK
jgi:general stress protein YciG